VGVDLLDQVKGDTDGDQQTRPAVKDSDRVGDSERTVNDRRHDRHDRKEGGPDISDPDHHLLQVIRGPAAGTISRNECAAFLEVVGHFLRIEGDRCPEVAEEKDQRDVEHVEQVRRLIIERRPGERQSPERRSARGEVLRKKLQSDSRDLSRKEKQIYEKTSRKFAQEFSAAGWDVQAAVTSASSDHDTASPDRCGIREVYRQAGSLLTQADGGPAEMEAHAKELRLAKSATECRKAPPACMPLRSLIVPGGATALDLKRLVQCYREGFDGFCAPDCSGLALLADGGRAHELMAVLAMDLIGYGQRIEDGTYFYQRYPAWSKLGRMVADTRAAIDALETLDFVNADKIYLTGYALGGTVSLFTSALDDRVAGTAVSSAFTPLRGHSDEIEGIKAYSHLYGLLPRLGFFVEHQDHMPVDFPEIISSIAPRPAYIIAPELDRHADTERVHETMKKVRSVYKLYEADNQLRFDTPFSINQFTASQREKIVEWLDQLE
jgi:pimeloyl-ACP methyl ester carboxylesterase